MSKMTESARGEQCTIRLPGVCNHNPETTVFAHLSGIRFGHGVGKKTQWGAYACSSCHDAVDGRVTYGWSLAERRLAHYEGIFETLDKLVAKGIVEVK